MNTAAITPEYDIDYQYANNHALLQAVTAFNFSPIDELNHSWVYVMNHGETLAEIYQHPRAKQYLSLYLMAQYNISDRYDFDFGDRLKRVCLLPQRSLQTFIRTLGVILNYPHINTLIQGKVIREVKNVISPERYEYSQKKAPFLVRQVPSFIHSFNGESPVKIDTTFADSGKLGAYLDHCGMRLLGAALGRIPIQNKWRMYWKLPREYKEPLAKAFSFAGDSNRHLQAQKILTKIIQKDNTPCFHLFD